jgi:hypothetical protein
VATVSLGTRLDKAMTTLSAQERGVLVLRSLKEKTPEDPIWRATMPRSQTAEFNRYIELMNIANMHLGHLITFIEGGWTRLTSASSGFSHFEPGS